MEIVGGRWSNWSGSVVCKPRKVVAPKDEVDLAAALRTAEDCVRVAGAGHSFAPLDATGGTLIDLAAFNGLLGFDPQRQAMTIAAGTPLWEIASLMHPEGYGLRNMNDNNRQTLGGVVGTGSHGTGIRLGSFSAEVASFRLVLASGEVIHCSPEENAGIFTAGRTSLGLLGVMTEIALKVRPAYKLEKKYSTHSVDELFRLLPGLIDANRHFEFCWYPYVDFVVCRTINETSAAAPAPRSAEAMRARSEHRRPKEYVIAAVNEALPFAPVLLKPSHWLFSLLEKGLDRVRWSHEIFPSPRTVRFYRLEYALACEKAPDALREIVDTIRKRRINTGYPLIYRTVAADDIWLSPYYRRESATIAVGQYHRADPTELFEACEAIFRRYEGRPHWGTRHTATAAELARLYPQFEAFRALRAKLDPHGKFLNNYLRGMFG